MNTLNKLTAHSLSFAALALSSIAVGCGAASTESLSSPGASASGEFATAEVLPVASDRPAATPDEIKTLVAGNTAFAVDLFREIRKTSDETENIFYSPHSISSALAMTYAGARGATSTAMAKTLHFDLVGGRLHAAFGTLDSRIIPAKADQSVTLRVANRLFGERTLVPQPAFTALLTRNYGAGMQSLDFIHAPDASRQTINTWVSNETNGRIEELLPSGTIDSESRLVLVNAIYFLGNWSRQFDPKLTHPAPFTLANGTATTAPSMHKIITDNTFYETDLFQSLRLRYKTDSEPGKGPAYELAVALPREGKLEQFESQLSRELIEQITTITSFESTQIDLHLPKFDLKGASVSLSPVLKKLGMAIAFDSAADFSGISASSSDRFHVSDVVHKAMVKVDETGTEAAAATAVIIARTTAMPSPGAPPVVMNVNRPFFVFLREATTGAVLFMGRVSNVK